MICFNGPEFTMITVLETECLVFVQDLNDVHLA